MRYCQQAALQQRILFSWLYFLIVTDTFYRAKLSVRAAAAKHIGLNGLRKRLQQEWAFSLKTQKQGSRMSKLSLKRE
jgi:hypothetical protein